MKSVISKNEYYQLIGLAAVAKQHDAVIRNMVAAMGAILDDPKPMQGHCCDVAYGHEEIDEILRKMDITVTDEPAPATPSGATR